MIQHPKENFLHLPTPLDYLPRLSEELGIKLYLKRDDLTGLGAGGNKLRKLEYFLQDARAQGATMLITVGGAQTNHGRLTAAVAARSGMKCAIVAMDDYPGELSSNLLLDRIMGAEVILHKDDGTDIMDVVAQVTDRYQSQGERVYFIPMGGSNELGALGYYDCAQEIKKQIDGGRVFVTVGSMGTYLGLFCGLHGSPFTLTGILIGEFYQDAKASALEYFEQCQKAWDLNYSAAREQFDIREQFLYGGYNQPAQEVRQAIYRMARTEAILLDPCYTGKTFAGLLSLVGSGEISQGETVIFLHTGGFPALHTPAHRREMEKDLINGVTLLP